MFTLEQPSMALNAIDDPTRLKMWNTWEVDKKQTREHIVEWVAVVAKSAPGKKLKNVVINCHGLPGYVSLGQGFNSTHLGLFKQWAGLVHKIWIVACLIAKIPNPKEQAKLKKDYPGMGTGSGHAFCSTLAQNIKGYVYAPTEIQRNLGGYKVGQMPTFEGLCLSYGPKGNITWQHRYSSEWSDNKE